MKKTFLNKFLSFSFKLGKILSSVLLIVTLIAIIGAGIVLLRFNGSKVETPSFSYIEDMLEVIKNEKSATSDYKEPSKDEEKTELDRYEKTIEAIVNDNSLPHAMKKRIKKYTGNVAEKYRKQYLKGLNQFYKEGFKSLEANKKNYEEYLLVAYKLQLSYYYMRDYSYAKKDIKKDGKYNLYLCSQMLEDYDKIFAENIEDALEKSEEQTASKIVAGYVLGGALLLFTILLFLPVLIKIEENTRLKLEGSEENETKSLEAEKTEETKKCPHCGAEIKKDAKKCRFCNNWLEENNN